MKAFPSKRSENYHKRRRTEQRNPTRGRTVAESNRIRRTCHTFANNLNRLIEETDCARMPWFPVADVITDRDDDAVIDWRAVAENMKPNGYVTDQYGMLAEMQDTGIRASNRIESVVVYSAEREDALVDFYMTRKTIFSPFPCPEWGFLPLTVRQWQIIALSLTESRIYWQWEAAVNHYAELRELPASYVYQYIVGWNLVECVRPPQQPRIEQEERPLWTGPIIYSLVTNGSFKLNMMNGYPE